MQTRPHTHAHEPTQTGDTPAVQQEKEVFMSEGRQSFIEFQSLLNAFKWTAYIISGATVASQNRPQDARDRCCDMYVSV